MLIKAGLNFSYFGIYVSIGVEFLIIRVDIGIVGGVGVRYVDAEIVRVKIVDGPVFPSEA